MADQLIPGHQDLGKGFDGFGAYSAASTANMGRLFDTSTPGYNDWENPYSGKVYKLPANVDAGPVGTREAQSVVFDSRSEMSSFFRGEAGVKGSYLSFSGSLSGSYEEISKRTSEFHYGMTYAFTGGYDIQLAQATPDHLAPEVLADPDYADLPDTYTPETQAKFFRFLSKYGSHFVSSVQMGGRIHYLSWIEKSFAMRKQEVEAEMKIEWKAVFNAHASAEWNKLNKLWTTSRKTRIVAIGGDNQLLDNLGQPDKGTSYYPQYKSWVDTVGAQPGPVGFKLTGVEALFSGTQYDAMKAAVRDYTGRTMRLQARAGAASIQVNGKPAFPPAEPRGTVGYAVLNRSSLEVVKANVYDHSTKYNKSYDQIAAELAGYQGNQEFVVAVLFSNIWASTANIRGYPSASLYDFLEELGAGEGLELWSRPQGSGAIGTAGPSNTRGISYAIAGVPGSRKGSAQEDFNFSTKADPNHAGSVTPPIDLEVFLRPETIGGKVEYSPT